VLTDDGSTSTSCDGGITAGGEESLGWASVAPVIQDSRKSRSH